MNDSDIEFIAAEEIIQAAGTQDTSLTTPEGNLHVVPSENQSKKWKEQKGRIMEKDQKIKSYRAKRVPPGARYTTESKWNSFPNRNTFFGDQSRRASRIDSWTIKSLCSSEWKKLHNYQERTESISWNKLRYGNQ